MAIIAEDYCDFEIAELLKEKGFQEPCTGLNKLLCKEGEKPVLRITHQKAMKWLREEYKIFICIVFLEDIDMYGFTIEDMSSKKYLATSKNDGYSTYEESCEAAIKYCLENLIK